MTPAERFRLAASICLVGGAVDVAVLAGWAWPRALAELEERGRLGARTTMSSTSTSTSTSTSAPTKTPAAPAPPAPVSVGAVTPGSPAALPSSVAGQASDQALVPASDEASDHDPDQASAAASPAPSPAPAGGPSSVGVILFRTRTGMRWIDPDKSFRRIVDLARRDPNLVLAIDGYADHGGDRRDRKRLSLLHARQIATALQSAGVSADRMIVRGHAGSRSRVRGLGRGKIRSTRRVEIRVHPREAP